jgi:hypothetical protein
MDGRTVRREKQLRAMRYRLVLSVLILLAAATAVIWGASGVFANPASAQSNITLSATWVADSSASGTMTLSWSALPPPGSGSAMSEVNIRVNDTGATDSSFNCSTPFCYPGGLALSQDSEYIDAAGGGMDDNGINPTFGQSLDTISGFPVSPNGTWDLQLEVEYASDTDPCGGTCLSNVVSVAATGTGATTTTAPATGLGQSISKTGQLLGVRGEVWVLPAAGGKVPATSGRAMTLGDTVETGPTGRVFVRLADGGVIELGPNSSFEIVEFVYDKAADEREVWIQDLDGVLRYLTGHGLICTTANESHCYEMMQTRRNATAPTTAVVAVRGSDVLVRTDAPGGRIEVDVHVGLAQLDSYKGKVLKADVYVHAGYRALITRQGSIAVVHLSAAEWLADLRSA